MVGADYGCGHGRTMAELEQHGYANLTGVDTSPGMIDRARHLHPTMRLAVLDAPPSAPYPNNSFDAILLFAVLTCIPSDEAQHRLIAELTRLHKPGGLLYISDLLLQDDERNRTRYNHNGVFKTSDGAICRHHSREWLSTLLTGFEPVHTRTILVTTMNGHESTGIQILARSPR